MVRALEILFPLYIYPQDCAVSTTACAWKPLYDSLSAYPNIQFTVIVDPQDGPGPKNTLPDSNYVAAITAINAYANAKTIGYVASTHSARPVDEYQDDVDTYLYWGTQDANLAMHGIFIDEASNDPTTIPYYTTFSQYIRNLTWPGGTPTVIHNQGATLPQSFFDAMPQDIFVTFENAYSVYESATPWTIWTDPIYESLPGPRQAVIFYNFTGTVTDMVTITDTSAEIRAFKYAFVTTGPDYNSWSTEWSTFVAAVNGTNAWMAAHPDTYP
ncbi:Spherulation-specific family 4 [Auriculariales sp. MPI-PUGE-AT-0066]|nr:Spherulation-specific family 4 [Auriculariales sp. MPI-PUGE-AT-0066]